MGVFKFVPDRFGNILGFPFTSLSPAPLFWAFVFLALTPTWQTKQQATHRCMYPPIGHVFLLVLTSFISPERDAPAALNHFPNPNAYAEFYKQFEREADKYENGFTRKYDEEAITGLIFVRSLPLRLRSFKSQSNLLWE